MSRVLRQIKENPSKRYLLIGLPCFIKAIRLHQQIDADLKRQIPWTIGLVCGHLKTKQFADFYAYALGLLPRDMKSINFRHKLSHNRVNNYGIKLFKQDGTEKTGENRNIFGTNWGYGFFKNPACDYCDDVLAETADITIGDAWLPAYEQAWQGTNILIVRNQILLDLLIKAKNDDRVHLENLSSTEIFRSQSSGLRHRREGLSYRLWLKEKGNIWHPKKRVNASPSKEQGARFGRKHQWRVRLSELSRSMFCQVSDGHSFKVFCIKMKVLVLMYLIAEKGFFQTMRSLPFSVYKKFFRRHKR